MSSITPTTSTTATAATTSPSATSPSATSKSLLGKDQFLQLMMAELKNQNPMSASSSDPMQYVTELAQFTSLEQQTNTAQATAQTATQQQTAAAVALIGHGVSYLDANGATVTGNVQSVEISNSGPTLTISGKSGINPSSVNKVS
jgi:flagellar basal-body rod modification protein FlgD